MKNLSHSHYTIINHMADEKPNNTFVRRLKVKDEEQQSKYVSTETTAQVVKWIAWLSQVR